MPTDTSATSDHIIWKFRALRHILMGYDRHIVGPIHVSPSIRKRILEEVNSLRSYLSENNIVEYNLSKIFTAGFEIEEDPLLTGSQIRVSCVYDIDLILPTTV